MDPDRALHDPRLEHVHHDQPADAHHDHERRQQRRPGCEEIATMTGGAQARNGPKNGIAIRGRPTRVVTGRRAAGRAAGASTSAMREVDDAQTAWPRRKPPNERATAVCEQPRLLGVARRDEPEEEGQDRVAVDDHVDRQDEHDQHRPDRAEAGHRDRLQRDDRAAPAISSRLSRTARPGSPGRPGRGRSSRASPAAGATIVGDVRRGSPAATRRTR